MTTHELQIKEIVAREAKAWKSKNIELLMSIFHPDMVWPWPPNTQAHDPMEWIFHAGRYDYERWSRNWRELFATHVLVHNRSRIRRIALTPEGDGAFAVVDVDTLWRDARGNDFHWLGRACKVYSKVGHEWKMTMHTGFLDYNNVNGSPHAAKGSSHRRLEAKQLRPVSRKVQEKSRSGHFRATALVGLRA